MKPDTNLKEEADSADTVTLSPTFYQGIASGPFPDDVQAKLMRRLKDEEIEIRPDGNLYFPEIKYRRVLMEAFGAGGWALVPVSKTDISDVLHQLGDVMLILYRE